MSVPRTHASSEAARFGLAKAVHARAAAMLDEVLGERRPALERVGMYVERHVAWYLAEPDELPAYTREWNALTGERRHRVLAWRRHHEARIGELVDAAKHDGDIDAGLDTRYATRYLLAAINDIPADVGTRGDAAVQATARAYAAMALRLLTGTSTRRPHRGAAHLRSVG